MDNLSGVVPISHYSIKTRLHVTLNLHTNSRYTASDIFFPIQQNAQLQHHLSKVALWCGLSEHSLKDFKADAKSIQTIYSARQSGLKVHLIGLGNKNTPSDALATARSATFKLKKQLKNQVAVELTHLVTPENIAIVEAFATGMLLGEYNIGLYKTDKPIVMNEADAMIHVSIHVAGFYGEDDSFIGINGAVLSQLKTALRTAQATATTQMRIFDLINAPSNYKTPNTLAAWAQDSGDTHGYKVTAWGRSEIEKNNLHALVAVNKGSEQPPAFLILEYKPKNKPKKLPKIGLIGKGVTFDTGGISIKGSTNMHFMKSDMGGAAAVLGTMELCAKLQLPVHLFGIIPATENCVDGKSIKPGDVIGSFAGKSIEIIDTDAEGRLILADGLAYMKKVFDPKVMIDLATLTGSCIQTLGYAASGMFTNNDKLAKQLEIVGESTGERVWRLPLWEQYADDLKSDVADLKNYSGKPTAGAISAAKFLEVFTDKHPAWVHLDIAGVAFSDGEFSAQRSATGYGIRLITAFLEKTDFSEY
jgi:leucyl aminopeptidase